MKRGREETNPKVVPNKKVKTDDSKIKALGKNPPACLTIPSFQEPVFDQLFQPIPDWALEEDWEEQTFNEFKTMERWPVKKGDVIYILPLGKISDDSISGIKAFAEFTGIYFQMEVKILPRMPIVRSDRTLNIKSPKYLFPLSSRKNEFGDQQLYDLDILRVIEEFLPADGYCVLAITEYDIYEWDDVEDVIMGRGTGDRVGVLSTYRFQPSKVEKKPKQKSPNDIISTCFLRSCKTMVHEVMHMFGLDHCVHYLCVMNANVSPNDDDADVIHLCPIDLRKLSHCIGIDVMARYAQLQKFYAKRKWQKELEWIDQRIEDLSKK